jgi:hypothetical protein
MERITLLYVGTEVDAETLTKLCILLVAPGPPAGVSSCAPACSSGGPPGFSSP